MPQQLSCCCCWTCSYLKTNKRHVRIIKVIFLYYLRGYNVRGGWHPVEFCPSQFLHLFSYKSHNRRRNGKETDSQQMHKNWT